MATTLSYLQTNFKRIYDRAKNNIDQGLVTISSTGGKFDGSCIDFTNVDHKGILFPDGIECGTDAFAISAWIKLTSIIDNFVFIGNKDDTTDIDSWETGNNEAISSETLDHTTLTNFTISSDRCHIVSGAIIGLDDTTWHHFLLTRVKGDPNDTLMQFVDGIKISETTLPNSKIIDFSQLVIGCSGGENSLIGYMDDFSFIKGANMWTDTFTPPITYIRNDPDFKEQFSELSDEITLQTTRAWSGSTDIIDVSLNPDIMTWELLELDKAFALKLS